MSVHTIVTAEELQPFLESYDLGELQEHSGIEEGVTNTIYFVVTNKGRYVLTLFEELNLKQLPFYLELLEFLSQKNIPCSKPIANNKGEYLQTLKNKPAVLMEYLEGECVDNADIKHCKLTGDILGSLHIISRKFNKAQKNTRGLDWINNASKKLFSVLKEKELALLKDELSFQKKEKYNELPQGIIHADLFRDNVLFSNEKLTGILDFYYACTDALLLDLAITVNDWCVNMDGSLDEEKTKALVDAYKKHRKLNEEEIEAWPAILRLAALRFWVSRLLDYYFSGKTGGEGGNVQVKDPSEFRRILEFHRSA